MYSREEYLKILQADLDRLQDSVGTENNSDNHPGITVTTTIDNKTTIVRTTQPNIGNITVSVGCLDFSRKGSPYVSDGVYVDGILQKEETIEDDKNPASRNTMRR